VPASSRSIKEQGKVMWSRLMLWFLTMEVALLVCIDSKVLSTAPYQGSAAALANLRESYA
jgi:hypothetical protein